MSDCSTNAFKVPKPELKPCPFCGGEIKHELMMDGAYSWNCNSCGLQARFPDDVFGNGAPNEVWNTRYQPTCSYKEIENQYYRCTNCGYEAHYYEYLPDEGEFCKGCGAHVEAVD